MKPSLILTAMLAWSTAASAATGPLEFVYEAAEELPEFELNGAAVKIHTQGLHVTQDYYWITGRLETPPKKSLLLRCNRPRPSQYEYVDLTPRQETLPGGVDGSTLDHPGGFDVDDEGALYVPLSTSHPRGPSLVYRLHLAHGAPLKDLQKSVVLVLDDHLGAVCLDHRKGHLLGANWDTKRIYRWTKTGQLVSTTDRTKLISARPDWQLAVQDWKGLPDGRILAGGIDKAPGRRATDSRAVIQYLDLDRHRLVASQRLPTRKDVTRPVTNEGLCLHAGKLYLIPEDIGRGAKILRYAPR